MTARHGLATIFLCIIAASAHAESINWRGYDIEYTTFVSTIIPADVARAHNIVRSDNRVITNIAVLSNGKPVAADIKGNATNLLNQLSKLAFREVREKTAIYYLANQIIDARDTIRYSIFIKPTDSKESYHLEFERQYMGKVAP